MNPAKLVPSFHFIGSGITAASMIWPAATPLALTNPPAVTAPVPSIAALFAGTDRRVTDDSAGVSLPEASLWLERVPYDRVSQ